MERINCKLGYDIEVDYEIEERVRDFLAGLGDNVFLITDTNVRKYYAASLALDALGKRMYVIKAGEQSKSLNAAGDICTAMIAAGCDRKTTVVALGGGVVGDLAGFVAAIFMRGVPYVQIPTTLLAMVDSSVGGKTAVDLGMYKNMIGAFKQPSRVLVCVDFLATLNTRELRSGLGEIIKTALLDKGIFNNVVEHCTELFTSEYGVMLNCIADCIRYKVGVVEADEKEAGLRRVLNLGHTIGHGLEAIGKHKYSHGEYVLNGIWYELKLARILNCVDEDYARRIAELVNLALEGEFRPLKRLDRIFDYIVADKKNTDGKICCILPVREGEVREEYYTHASFRQILERIK